MPEEAHRRVWVPVPGDRRRYRLTVMIGQPDGRLRVISTPVTIARSAPFVVPGGPALPPAYPWPRRAA